jgi:DNA mismatch endonuclease Vsr
MEVRPTPKTRSEIMASVRSRGNRSTEWALRCRLMNEGIRGWKVCLREVPGTPDFVFVNERVAVFVDGCQWHGCPDCYRAPKSNQEYWQKKLIRNRDRDRTVDSELRALKWRVIRIWEHELREDPEEVIRHLRTVLKR